MTVSRRHFFRTSAALAAAATAASTITALDAAPSAAAVASAELAALPATELIALNRMGYGPRPGDADRVRTMGVDAYIDEQLAPEAINDADCDARLAAARLQIGSEARALTTLNQQIPELWQRARWDMMVEWEERVRPFEEVRVATWLRAIYSKRQLLEVLADFWHNHFNVNATSNAAIAATMPAYDRDVIRKNALGNFRTFLEDVAKSAAMMYYLDNVSNRAGGGEGGNENYARELFELHTLSSDNYLKFYDNRDGVGSIEYNGKSYARGYIDDDVYEAALCFSGWTIKNGHWERPTLNDGTFYYDQSWHYTGAKIVLSLDGRPTIPRSQADLKDGHDVLDMLAGHPGTARHICTKLCRRFIADNPPAAVVDAAVAEWMANISAPDQIKKVLRVILRSAEFKSTWGQKVKRPFDLIVSFLRATNAEMPVDTASKGYWGSMGWVMSGTGHRLFEWPTPTGHPDVASHWVSSDALLRRWNLPYILTQDWAGNIKVDLVGQTNLNQTCTQIVDFWISRLCGYSINATVRQELIAFMAQGGNAGQPPRATSAWPDWNSQDAVPDRLFSMVQLLAASPDFQVR